jgi:hypothetical protein
LGPISGGGEEFAFSQIEPKLRRWENRTLSRARHTIQRSRLGVLMAVCFVAGCGTPFKYNPQHDRSYPAVPNRLGVEIAGGIDERPEGEKRPAWSRDATAIVAHALADEIHRDGLFHRVKIHLQGPAKRNKFSYFIEFRVEAFAMFPQSGIAEKIGRKALDTMGWRGALISASIPATWESDVKVEFEVFDAGTQQPVFRRNYSESKTLKANGYQGQSRPIQQTSDCLETVLQRFAADFSQVALK